MMPRANSQNTLKALSIVSDDYRSKYRLLVGIRSIVGLFDVVALAIFALLGQVAIQSTEEFDKARESGLLQLIPSKLTHTQAILAIALIGLVFFATKSATTLIVNARLHNHLSKIEVMVGTHVYANLMQQQVDSLKGFESQSLAQVLSTGVSAATIRSLSFRATALGEGLLVVVIGGLFVLIEPLLTIVLGLYFALLAAFLHKLIARPSELFGRLLGETTVNTTRTVQESLRTARELRLLGRTNWSIKQYESIKRTAAESHAHLLTLVYAPRQIVDTSLLLGVFIATSLFLFQNELADAIRSTGFLLIAGTRLAPSLLALQGAISSLKVARGESTQLYSLLHSESTSSRSIPQADAAAEMKQEVDNKFIVARGITFRYRQSNVNALTDVSFSIARGSITAITGPSGSGKTTLVDVLLGFLNSEGSVTIEGQSPSAYSLRSPGKIGYLPQDAALVTGTIAQNVALGHSESDIDLDRVEQVLSEAGLWDFVQSLPNGLHTPTGEYGGQLSGGQRQRVGMARALYGRPELLVLDESTSALDDESERIILDLLDELRGTVTVIMIAHKASAIERADQILTLRQGKLVDP